LEDTDTQDRKVAFVILLCAAPFFFFFLMHGGLGRARAAAVFVGVFSTTIWTRRHLRRKVWFWIVLAILAAGHVPLILLVHWSDAWISSYGLLGMGLIDFAYVCGPIWLIEEAMSRESKIS
jgi:hypothetical protein